jgi:hypothetical protein
MAGINAFRFESVQQFVHLGFTYLIFNNVEQFFC